MNKARGGKDVAPETGRRWRQWKEPEARAVLADWARSGLSAAAFAKSRGFSEKRMNLPPRIALTVASDGQGPSAPSESPQPRKHGRE